MFQSGPGPYDSVLKAGNGEQSTSFTSARNAGRHASHTSESTNALQQQHHMDLKSDGASESSHQQLPQPTTVQSLHDFPADALGFTCWWLRSHKELAPLVHLFTSTDVRVITVEGEASTVGPLSALVKTMFNSQVTSSNATALFGVSKLTLCDFKAHRVLLDDKHTGPHTGHALNAEQLWMLLRKYSSHMPQELSNAFRFAGITFEHTDVPLLIPALLHIGDHTSRAADLAKKLCNELNCFNKGDFKDPALIRPLSTLGFTLARVLWAPLSRDWAKVINSESKQRKLPLHHPFLSNALLLDCRLCV